MCALCSHILHIKPKNRPSLLPRNFTSKSTLGQQFHIQMVKGNLLVDIQQWTKLTTDFQLQYHQQKQISRYLNSILPLRLISPKESNRIPRIVSILAVLKIHLQVSKFLVVISVMLRLFTI